jgi:hypothetical protein
VDKHAAGFQRGGVSLHCRRKGNELNGDDFLIPLGTWQLSQRRLINIELEKVKNLLNMYP